MMLDSTNYLDSKSLRSFVQAASSEPLPGDEEEAALADAIGRGEKSAVDELIRLHLRDVVDEAILHRGDVAVGSLIRQGVRGLVAAARGYEPARHGPFGSYAREFVRREIRAVSLRPQ